MHSIIEVNNISKQYRLGTIGTGSMAHDLNRWWHRLLGKEDPYLRIGEANDRSTKGSSEYVWALRDISFTVQPGEVLGIIGRNGAGKSTLLKILSRITTPSTGSIKLGGRVASLLEVGTGMHPELTGRENIYLNGAILGMRKKEIDRKLDAIVDFSGVERYLDTPVKRYSSGMHVRLGFAVAAHLEPEILIVDEVLAVGDAEFQKKCLGKMGEVSKSGGKTILFVSHSMASIKALCSKCILLENGRLNYASHTDEVIKKYLSGDRYEMNYRKIDHMHEGFYLDDVILSNSSNSPDYSIYRDKPLALSIQFKNSLDISNLYFNIKIKDDEGKYILVTTSAEQKELCNSKNTKATMLVPAGFFNEGSYVIELMVIQRNGNGYKIYYHEPDLLHFQLLPEKRELGSWMGKEEGYIRHIFECNN